MDWKSIVTTVAPWIGTALGGPMGGAAVSAIADALGLSEKTEASIKTALSGVTPEQMLAIKNADQQFALKMQELGFSNIQTMERLGNDDRDSARQREMAVKDNTPKVLAYAVTLGFFGVLATMMFYDIPMQSQTAVNIMLGSLGTAWAGVMAYYYGANSGSNRTKELLASAIPPTGVK